MFLDVDDLENISLLERDIVQSRLFLMFVSRGYFTSKACQSELKSALRWQKPLLMVSEPNDQYGGGSWEKLVKDCPQTLEVRTVSDTQAAILEAGDMARLFDDPSITRLQKMNVYDNVLSVCEVVSWQRLKAFQDASLTRIASHILAANKNSAPSGTGPSASHDYG